MREKVETFTTPHHRETASSKAEPKENLNAVLLFKEYKKVQADIYLIHRSGLGYPNQS